MSSGVSDQQMKSQGDQGKHVEEKHIPWSQQVAEESYENLSSPTEDNSATSSGAALFQYPPFNCNDNSINQTNLAQKSNYENEDYNKGYGKHSYYNNSRKDDYNNSSWNSYHLKKSNNNYDHRANKYNYSGDNYKANQRDVRRNSNDSGEIKNTNEVKTNPSEASKSNVQTSFPKKMTWASIASQPAKHALRPVSTNSTLKKKGPGMPPPPMVPGKHNMDMLNTWDVGNSSPTPVPPSPPPVIPFSIAEKNTSSTSLNVHEDNTVRRVDKHINSDSESSNQVNRQKRNNQNTSNHIIRSIGNTGDASQQRWISQNPPSQHYRNINSNAQNNKKYNHNHAASSSYEGRYQYTHDKYQRYPSVHNDVNETNETKTNSDGSATSTEIVPANSNDLNPPVLDELKTKNNYNPVEINLKKAALARFFVIKSYSEDDVHRSIKYEIWCSTDHGNKRLDEAFREREKENGIIYLLFSVNGSGHFCGMAQMMTPVDYNSISSVWSQDKWKGKFKVKWIYVKDVPNTELRNIRLENNENKAVTHSRDAQEVPNAKGIQIIKILHSYKHQTSIFDDFNHYEKRQKEEISKKVEPLPPSQPKIVNNQNQSTYRIYRQGEGESDREKNTSHNKFAVGGFRDKSNYNRGGFHNNNYYDNRRTDYTRSGGNFESNPRESRENNDSHHQTSYQNRENSDYNNRGLRYDYRSRDDRDNRAYPKHNNREQRDFHHDMSSGNGGFLHRGDNRNLGGFNKDSFSRDNDYHNRDGRGRGANHRN